MSESTRRFFYCYSSDLYNLLREKGLRYNCKGLHPKTKALFYQYDYSPEFIRALEEYSNRD